MAVTEPKKNHYSDTFDEGFSRVPHYLAYPRMRPFVGCRYAGAKARILLVGESHYLPKSQTLHLDAQRWYQGQEGDFRPGQGLGWIHTREILNKSTGEWRKQGHAIYRNLDRALYEAGFQSGDSALEHIAFMNGFQRPARERLSLEVAPEDIEVGRETLAAVIDILRPDGVIFVSRKAARHLSGELKVPHGSVPHPASAWWNRASRRGTGKNQFIQQVSRICSGKAGS